MSNRIRLIGACTALFVLVFGILASAQTLPGPEQILGFKPGEDYKLAGWTEIVNYFKYLDDESEKIKVLELGETTLGNPFIMAVISSEENIQKLDHYKGIARQLARAKGLSQERASQLCREGKLILLITCSMHSTEVGATQMSPELAHYLLTEDTPLVREILDNVILLLVPSFNPDGLIMVKDWYDKYLQTPFEGSYMPWLYHTYTGHDNNRDAFMLTQKESKLVNQILYKDWLPQIYLDMHQMGNRGARLFIPPFHDPINPNVHPLIWRETALIGEHIAVDLESKGFAGIVTEALFTGWWQGAFLMTAWFHNVVGMLTELASVKIASPIFQTKDDLRGGGRGMPDYKPSMNFPHPWPGGWWRLRDIINYDREAALSLLDISARSKYKFLFNFYLMGKEAIEKGKKEPPFAYLVPPRQRDTIAKAKMIDILMEGGVEIHQAQNAFTGDGIEYPKGTYVILMSQPYRAYAKDMLEPQRYPDIRQYSGGPPIPPYDVAGWTLPYQMGVKVVEVIQPFDANLVKLSSAKMPEGEVVGKGGRAYLLGHESNNAFIAINRLLKDGYDVYWSEKSFSVKNKKYPQGTIIIPTRKKGVHKKISSLASDLHLKIYGTSSSIKGNGYKLKPFKLAVYQPWLASMHEGWSRWILEQYEFPYKNIHNAELRAGALKERYDVIYLPDIWAEGIFTGREEGTVPPQYAKGIGPEGLANLKQFVEAGGTLITMDSSSELLLGDFGLPVINTLKKVKSKDFFCPGSILKMEYDNSHPVAFGMDTLSVAFFARSPAFKLIPSFTVKCKTIAKYPKSNLLMSGWILGEKHLSNKAAVVEVPMGKGRVILIGFDALNRAQAHATFKIFFNALHYGAAQLVKLP